MPCDFESLYYTVKQELLDIYREADRPIPRIRLRDMKSTRLCGMADLAKVMLYLEGLGVVHVVNKEEHFQNWEADIMAQVLDVLFEQI
jgi:hypothetical protein